MSVDVPVSTALPLMTGRTRRGLARWRAISAMRLARSGEPGAKLRTGWFWGRVIVCSF
jgi:hypothetical protein